MVLFCLVYFFCNLESLKSSFLNSAISVFPTIPSSSSKKSQETSEHSSSKHSSSSKSPNISSPLLIINNTGMEKEFFKKICMANNLMAYKDNKLTNLNVTHRPSPFPYTKIKEAMEKQKIMNKLFFNILKDKTLLNLKSDDKMYLILKSIQELKTKKQVEAVFLRTDYLLDEDGEMVQVEINAVSCAFVIMGSRINFAHSLFYKNVLVSEAEAKFINFIQKIKNVFGAMKDENVVALMVDNDTSVNSSNYFEKIEIMKLLKIKGIKMLHVTMDDIKENGRWILKSGKTCHKATWDEIKEEKENWNDSTMFYRGEKVFLVYYRWFYNHAQYSPDDILERLKIEMSSAVSLPSVELQMVGLKNYQLILKDKNILKKFLSDEEAESIYRHFGHFKSVDEFNEGDEDLYVLKSLNEGGGFNVFGKNMKYLLHSNGNNNFLMKIIKSPTFKNSFIKDGVDREVVCEIGVMGTLISSGSEIIENDDCGYICRTKDVESKECGVSCGFGALDSVFSE